MGAKKKGVKVLIVDDEEGIREVIGYILEKRGFIAEDAGNGKKALEKVAQEKPDIIILDIAMPEMDGLQTCKRLRENPDTQDIPIIFLSAQSRPTALAREAPGAPIEYIGKPCDIEHLLRRIDSLV